MAPEADFTALPGCRSLDASDLNWGNKNKSLQGRTAIVTGGSKDIGRGIDVLCANAGIFPSAKIGEMTPQDFDFVMDTNLKNTFLCVSAVPPHMKQKKSGWIVITSSITEPITGLAPLSHDIGQLKKSASRGRSAT